ncbi:hypothetical protein ABT369_55185 [Dactylosporangium sp. NPDC000244]
MAAEARVDSRMIAAIFVVISAEARTLRRREVRQRHEVTEQS